MRELSPPNEAKPTGSHFMHRLLNLRAAFRRLQQILHAVHAETDMAVFLIQRVLARLAERLVGRLDEVAELMRGGAIDQRQEHHLVGPGVDRHVECGKMRLVLVTSCQSRFRSSSSLRKRR